MTAGVNRCRQRRPGDAGPQRRAGARGHWSGPRALLAHSSAVTRATHVQPGWSRRRRVVRTAMTQEDETDARPICRECHILS